MIQEILNYEIPLWIALSVLVLLFLYSRFLSSRDMNKIIDGVKSSYDAPYGPIEDEWKPSKKYKLKRNLKRKKKC